MTVLKLANNLSTIPAFEAGTNPSESWRHWKEDYLEALRYSEALEKTKTALFRHLCGEELKKQLRAFDLKPNDGCEGVTLQQGLQEFDKYFLDYQNEVFASFKFLEIKQEQGEKFTDCYSRLRNAVVECNYGESQDHMLRDKLIQGLLDKALQERLIRETSKKARALQEVASECKTAENSKVQASVMNEKLTVKALKNFKNYRKQSINNQKNEFNCKQCGKKHEKKKCPAFGTKCRNCDGRNHWAKMCRTQSKRKNMAARRVNAMEENSENSDTIYIGELKSMNWTRKKPIVCELLKWDEKPVVRNCKIAVLDYSDNRLPILGECYLNCETKSYHKTSVNYLGHVLSDEGIKPDPKKIRAIEEFATPNCKEDLQRFLGMLEYVPGKNLVTADALSRVQSTTDNFDEVLGQEATVRINLLTQASPAKWEEIASLTAGDPEMQDVLFHINNGWPQ
ncbi:reverse transcriptase domain-containing protein [Trichonephila inaurata madagascariensis]|uniref:Reverse transcriptase domain-containing protein n=1 Tax=Trichonephila inaurata madagascariensis TaxID=2747483 RepID=A0A8X6XFZ3_9ARAC|nr:reverse transcriptase domain-containing protein [Trichonephila inaurata madagascariensis]